MKAKSVLSKMLNRNMELAPYLDMTREKKHELFDDFSPHEFEYAFREGARNENGDKKKVARALLPALRAATGAGADGEGGGGGDGDRGDGALNSAQGDPRRDRVELLPRPGDAAFVWHRTEREVLRSGGGRVAPEAGKRQRDLLSSTTYRPVGEDSLLEWSHCMLVERKRNGELFKKQRQKTGWWAYLRHLVRLNGFQRFFACARGDCITNPHCSVGSSFVTKLAYDGIGPGAINII